MNNGCIYLIEYGRKDKSVLNKLGTNKIYHYECGINWKLIKLFSRKFFQIEDEGPLSHLFHIDLPVTKKIIFYLINLFPNQLILGITKFYKKLWLQFLKLIEKIKGRNIYYNNAEDPSIYKNPFTRARKKRLDIFFYFVNKLFGKGFNKIVRKIIHNFLNKKDRFIFLFQINRKIHKYSEAFYFLKLLK